VQKQHLKIIVNDMGQRLIISIIILSFLYSCYTPRTVSFSGKVTEHKKLAAGGNFSVNIPTATTKYLIKTTESVYESYKKRDTIINDVFLSDINTMFYAYCLDPIKTGTDFYLRYGLFKDIDVGYKYSGGIHVFDSRFQFMHYDKNNFDASAGIQFASTKYELPDKLYLRDLQELLGFEFKRKDLLIPVVFSLPFGENESYGAFGFGLVYGRTFLSYSFIPEKIVIENYDLSFKNQKKQNYSSLGTVINIKGGYKRIFAKASLTTYYQNYKEYRLLNGKDINIKGMSIIPSLGLEILLGKKQN